MDQLVPELYGCAEEGKARRKGGREGRQEEGRRASTLALTCPTKATPASASGWLLGSHSIRGRYPVLSMFPLTCGLLTRSCNGQGWSRAFDDNESFSMKFSKIAQYIHRSYSIGMYILYCTCTASYPNTVRRGSSEVESQLALVLLITSGIGINHISGSRPFTYS